MIRPERPAISRSRVHRLAGVAGLACVLVGLALAPRAACAQIPGLPSLKSTGENKARGAPSAPASETPEQAIQRLRERLEEIRSRPVPAPAGVSPAENDVAREAREALIFIYERQIRAYDELGSAREARAQSEARERQWKGFSESAPYSIQMVDRLRDSAATARARIDTLEAGILYLEAELARNREAARRAEAAERAATEAYTHARGDADRALADWRRNAATLDARRTAGWVALNRLLLDVKSEELAARRAESRLLERQTAAAGLEVRFTEDDVAAARKRSANANATLTKSLDSVRIAADTHQRERDVAERELARLTADPASAPDRVAVAQARLRAAEAWLDVLRAEAELLRGQIVFTHELPNLWAQRLAAATSEDADARRDALARLVDGSIVLGRWLAFMQSPLNESRVALREAETHLRSSTESGAATIEHDRQLVAAAVHALTTNERTRDEMARYSSLLNRWVAELKAKESSHSPAARLADAWSAASELIREVWNFELFAVEDTVVVDGRTVSASHGITVGKSVGAVLLFLGGYGLAALLTKRFARWLVARGIDQRLVGTARRWSLALIGLVLLLFTLNIARIPLTAFAFLGGTLAIAIGFGTQTIFKNLISGMILLGERSVQIGDIVEVDTISGTVTAVDLRSSTIQGFDGTETIVPNSLLLENKFTNWTRNDRRVRRIVRVGVAYGSPVRQVADILEDCAKRHGLVLDEPAPLAIFEDFGDNAQVFALYLWFEFTPDASLLVVLSDLRFMIEKQLREAGIVIAFPQRDVHLDSSGPLRVELVRGGESAPS